MWPESLWCRIFITHAFYHFLSESDLEATHALLSCYEMSRCAKHHSLQVLNNVVAILLKGMNDQYVANHSNPIILVRALKKEYSQHLAWIQWCLLFVISVAQPNYLL
jgi:hypothetical protein